jgi:hypothetical protein
MIRLDTTTRTLQALLSGAITTNQLNVTTSYSDASSSSFTGATTVINTNNTTAVTLAAAPSAGLVRTIDSVTVYNADTVAATVTVRFNDNGTVYPLVRTTLLTGETLGYTHGFGWFSLDVNGNRKQVTASIFSAVTTGALSVGYITNTAATYAWTASDHTVRQTTIASVHTLPSASANPNRKIRVGTEFAGTVTSASSNVVPLAGGAAGTAILSAVAGRWADLQSNGTNWIITAAN